MQLHAVQLLAPDGMAAIIDQVIASERPEDGSPTAILGRALETYCR